MYTTATQMPQISGINELETDYKAEVVAASLLGYYHAAERIFIKRMGINDRAKNKDVVILKNKSFNMEDESLIIETNREGIYDYMPEGTFHIPTLGNINNSTDNIIEEIRKQKKAEEEARLFFMPFELEASYVELSALYYENCLDNKGANEDLLNVLKELWPIMQQLDESDAKTFIHLLPFFHAARGNKIWFQKCMTAFLGYPVAVTNVHHLVEEDSNANNLLLSRTTLGINTLLCGNHYNGNVNWQINIGPVEANDISKFIVGSNFNKLLYAIYDYCLPAYITALQQCVTTASGKSFTLPPTAAFENYLGYTTFI
jgi:hypothetical protein